MATEDGRDATGSGLRGRRGKGDDHDNDTEGRPRRRPGGKVATTARNLEKP
jgi:hypothetical protein